MFKYSFLIQYFLSMEALEDFAFKSLSTLMRICASKLAIIGSDSGLTLGGRQAIIWTNTGLLLIQTLETDFSGILSKIHTFLFKKITWKCRLRSGGYFVSASMRLYIFG